MTFFSMKLLIDEIVAKKLAEDQGTLIAKEKINNFEEFEAAIIHYLDWEIRICCSAGPF